MMGLACGDSSTEPLPACSGDVTLALTGGTTPIVSWTPACAAEQLAIGRPVSTTSGFDIEFRWMVQADGPRIDPPVRYGRTPRGAVVVFPATELVVGESYVVWLGYEGNWQRSFESFTP